MFERFLWCLAIIFLLTNTVAFFHAYQVTHFNSSGSKTKNAQELTLVQKLGLAIFGVSNPRPQTKDLPDTVYQTIRIKSNAEIKTWMIDVDSSKGTVILFHGYGGEVSSLLDKAKVSTSRLFKD